MVKKISEKEFKECVKEGLSVVDFSATWCGPCQMLAPVLEQVSEEYGEEVKFFAVDVDEAPKICRELGIMSVPSVFIFKNGEQKDMSIGFVPKEALEAFINKNK